MGRILVLIAIGAAIFGGWWWLDPRASGLWLATAKLAVGASAIALALGTLIAVGIAKTAAPGRHIAEGVLAAMLFVPMFLVGGAWDAGFGMQGWYTLSTNPHLAEEPWLDGWRAAIWIHGIAAVPAAALVIGAGLRRVEAELEEDASTCLAPWRVVARVSLPRAAPAILVAALVTAILASTEIGVTDLYQIRTFAEEVYTQSALGSFDFNPDAESWIAVPLGTAGLWLGIALSTLLAAALLVGARRMIAGGGTAFHRRTWLWRWGSGAVWGSLAIWLPLLIVAGVPLVNLVHNAGMRVTATAEGGRVRDWSAAKALERIARAPLEFRGELWQSAQIGAVAATAALVLAVPLAWSLRKSPRVGRLRLLALALCLTIPGPILGIGLIRLLNQSPDSLLAPLAELYDSRFAPWAAQTIRAFPFVTLIMWSALATIPQAMLDAAAIDGAGWWRQLWWIALPQRWGAVAAAWLIGLAVAVGELAATVLVMPPARHTVISVRVFQLLHYGVDDRVAAISLVMALAVGATAVLGMLLLRRKT